jgi:hypothetical protein
LILYNKIKKAILAVFTAGFFCLQAYSQPGQQEQLASQYLENREFDKAAGIFKELFESNPSLNYFQEYMKCIR